MNPRGCHKWLHSAHLMWNICVFGSLLVFEDLSKLRYKDVVTRSRYSFVPVMFVKVIIVFDNTDKERSSNFTSLGDTVCGACVSVCFKKRWGWVVWTRRPKIQTVVQWNYPNVLLVLDTCLCRFADVDECQRDADVCPPRQTCKNTFGSFVCVCRDGFVIGTLQGSVQCRGAVFVFKWSQRFNVLFGATQYLLVNRLPRFSLNPTQSPEKYSC